MRGRTVPTRDRKAPTLIQNVSGAWYARFRREGISLPLGVRTPKRGSTEEPPATSRYEWIQIGKRYYPKHVYDRFHSDFVTPYLRGEFVPTRTSTDTKVETAIERFLDRSGLTASTRRSYQSVLGLFLDSLVDRRMLLEELRQADIEAFLGRPQLRSHSSKASYGRQINAFLNWCRDGGMLDDSLKANVKGSAAGRLGRKLFLSPEDYLRVRESIRLAASNLPGHRRETHHISWTIDVFDLAISTGLRLDELVHLQWKDVRIDRGTLEVRPKTEDLDGFNWMPKGKRARFIELQPLAIEVFGRSRVARHKDQPLSRVLRGPLVGPNHGLAINPNRASKLWRKHRDHVRISDPVPLHGLRHMFVSYLLILGYETFYVQNWAGHASITTTEGYAQFTRQLCSRRERQRLVKDILKLGFSLP